MNKDSLILHTEYKEQIEYLDMEQRGKLFSAILCYQAGESIPEMDAITKMCFSFIRQRMDRDNEAYEEKCKRNTSNIRKRWNQESDTTAYDSIPNDTTRYDSIRDDTTEKSGTKSYSDPDPDIDPDPDTDTETDIEPEPEKEPEGKKGATPLKKAAKPLAPIRKIEEMGYPPDLEEVVKAWVKYKTEKRQGYKATGLSSLLSKIAKECSEHGETAVIALIQEAMANNWQGIVWERIGGRSPNDRIANRVKEVDKWEF